MSAFRLLLHYYETIMEDKNCTNKLLYCSVLDYILCYGALIFHIIIILSDETQYEFINTALHSELILYVHNVILNGITVIFNRRKNNKSLCAC